MLARDSSSKTPIKSSKLSALLHSSSNPLNPNSSPSQPSNIKGNSNQFQVEWNFLGHLRDISDEQNVLHLLERPESNSFVLFGDEASIVAQVLFNSESTLTQPFGPEYPSMCVLNHLNLFSTLLQEFLLLRDGWRVEVWTWDSLRKAFKLDKRASPGNLESVEDILSISLEQQLNDLSPSQVSSDSSIFSNNSSISPIIAAVLVNSGLNDSMEISIAWCDLSSLKIGYLSFTDNSLLTCLESALVQIGVRELLFPKDSASTSSLVSEKIKQIAAASEMVLQQLKPNEFFYCEDIKGMEHDLARLIGEDRIRINELNLSLTKTLRCLFSYLNLLGMDSNIGAFKFVNINLNDFARLDEAALTSLNIFPKNGTGISSNNVSNASFSLLGYLDHCKTIAGSRTLNQWLRQPLTNKTLIENRLDLIELFVHCPEGRHQLREVVLRGIPDVTKLLKKLARARSSLQELVQLYQLIAKLHQIIMKLDSNEEIKNNLHFAALNSVIIEPMQRLTEQLSPYVQMIEDTIDFEALGRNEYCLRADFDPILQELSSEKLKVLNSMEPEFKRVCSVLKLEAGKKCKLERNSVYGYFFRVSRLDATKLNQLKDKDEADNDNDEEYGSDSSAAYTELSTLKSGVLFVTPKLAQLARRYDALSQEYSDKQSTLVTSLLAAAQPFRPAFDVLGTLISMLDVLLSIAHVSGTSAKPFVRPLFCVDEQNFMELKAARHPCVEVQPQVNFIPNDVTFDRSTGKILQFITGPNMGGKSTFIRQTALIAIMAQCGFFVPCDSATIPIFDAILVRVGAGDNILRGISTFMAEMLETATILQTATKNSLVVIDELGRGTSTCDGIALSRAISEHLAINVQCFTFFATHFHELTDLSNSNPKFISNLHVAVEKQTSCRDGIDNVDIVLLFKVKPGPCEESYGVHVAKAVGFPDVVLKMAQWRADLLEGRRSTTFTVEEEDYIKNYSKDREIPVSLQKYLI